MGALSTWHDGAMARGQGVKHALGQSPLRAWVNGFLYNLGEPHCPFPRIHCAGLHAASPSVERQGDRQLFLVVGGCVDCGGMDSEAAFFAEACPAPYVAA